jgi:hypothetical protein
MFFAISCNKPNRQLLHRIHLPDRLELWCKAPGDGRFGRSGGALDACFWYMLSICGMIGVARRPSSLLVSTLAIPVVAPALSAMALQAVARSAWYIH